MLSERKIRICELFKNGEPPYNLKQVWRLFNETGRDEWLNANPFDPPENFKELGLMSIRRDLGELVEEGLLFVVARRKEGKFYSHKPYSGSLGSRGLTIPLGSEHLDVARFVLKLSDRLESPVADQKRWLEIRALMLFAVLTVDSTVSSADTHRGIDPVPWKESIETYQKQLMDEFQLVNSFVRSEIWNPNFRKLLEPELKIQIARIIETGAQGAAQLIRDRLKKEGIS